MKSTRPRSPWQIRDFREAILDSNGYEGLPYTWSNKRIHPHTVKARLPKLVLSFPAPSHISFELWCLRSLAYLDFLCSGYGDSTPSETSSALPIRSHVVACPRM
uniref:Uncharacterized protein n=1 Tax=Utricularia reniformis TaxID=192314 RepID=A0A1Y0B195_9LAMI|nr:hypothetical protein AEK19_MT0937 [Utricularia reniformis]ART31161.1 hypothetical protein AEK19_MT0937 [Utricularia reniformis]